MWLFGPIRGIVHSIRQNLSLGKICITLYFMNYDVKSLIRTVTSWLLFMAQKSFNTGNVPVDDNIQMHNQCFHLSNRTKIYQNRSKSRTLFSVNSDQIRTYKIRLLPDFLKILNIFSFANHPLHGWIHNNKDQFSTLIPPF